MDAEEVMRRYGRPPRYGGPPNINTQVGGRAAARVARQLVENPRGFNTGQRSKPRERQSVSNEFWTPTGRSKKPVNRPTERAMLAAWRSLDVSVQNMQRGPEVVMYKGVPLSYDSTIPDPLVDREPEPTIRLTYTGPLTTCAGYLDKAIHHPEAISDLARATLEGIEYDTLVGLGLSGSLVVPWLAKAMSKYWAIVRKNDGSHSSYNVEGTIGRRWVFVDDLICTGTTLRNARERMEQHCTLRRHLTDYVGAFTYQEPTPYYGFFLPRDNNRFG